MKSGTGCAWSFGGLLCRNIRGIFGLVQESIAICKQSSVRLQPFRKFIEIYSRQPRPSIPSANRNSHGTVFFSIDSLCSYAKLREVEAHTEFLPEIVCYRGRLVAPSNVIHAYSVRLEDRRLVHISHFLTCHNREPLD